MTIIFYYGLVFLVAYCSTFDKSIASLSPEPGTYTKAQNITIIPPIYANKTYYTLDESDPSDETNLQKSTRIEYINGAKVSIDAEDEKSVTLKVVSFDKTNNPGLVRTAVYTFNKSQESSKESSKESSSDESSNKKSKKKSKKKTDRVALQVIGIMQNGLYNTDKTIIFTNNSSRVTSTLNGQSFTSGTKVTEEGIYELIVIDKKGNQLVVNFTIDKTPPARPEFSLESGTYETSQQVSIQRLLTLKIPTTLSMARSRIAPKPIYR